MKVLLIGSNGQLGKSIIERKPNFAKLICPPKKDLDLREINKIKEKIYIINPDFIINCGAFTQVDLAEKEPKEAYLINHEATRELALATLDINSKLLHISTDYVFDGNTNYPYKPNSKKNPINNYGKSKTLGENEIEEILNGTNAVIVRTSWLVSHLGENFVHKIINLHNKNKPMHIVEDQYGSLTSTYSLSQACWQIIELFKRNSYKKSDQVNLLHWSSRGITSWYEIALAIGDIGVDLNILNHRSEIIPVKSTHFKTNAKRPFFSVLDCSESELLLGLKTRPWQEELRQVMHRIFKNKK